MSEKVEIYDGMDKVGSIEQRRAGYWIARDAEDRIVGTFSTARHAQAAVLQAARNSVMLS